MEKNILKWGSVVVSVCLLLAMSFLYVYPSIQAKMLQAEDQTAEMETEDTQVVSAADYAESQPEEVVEEDEDLNGRLKLELPEGITAGDLVIQNDYLTQTVTVKFPTECENYFTEYHLRGSCSTIDSISYYRDGDDGVVALTMNMLYEIETELSDNSVYISFVDPHDIYDKVVVIDAGHGAEAIGCAMDNICEKDINLAIMLQLRNFLQSSDQNIGVYCTRTDDSNPTLDQRVQLANKARADLFISVHNNSNMTGKFSSLTGTQVLYSESDTSELSSEKLARLCLAKVTASCGSRTVGILMGDNIYIIRTSEVPVALVEVGYMTNQEELANLNSADYQKKAAEGIYEAILEAFQEGY